MENELQTSCNAILARSANKFSSSAAASAASKMTKPKAAMRMSNKVERLKKFFQVRMVSARVCCQVWCKLHPGRGFIILGRGLLLREILGDL